MSKILYNGEIKSRDDVSIDLEDRAYQFGDGIYEVIGVYNGKFFKMPEHLERLERSASELKLTLPYNICELGEKLQELCVANHLQNGTVYLQISRGVAKRAHYFPRNNAEPVLIGYTQKREHPVSLHKEGVNCILTEDIRWLRCDIKTLNLLGSVLAKQEAVEKDCYEAILHRDGIVTEGSSTNLFIVKDGELFTHPANNYILNGITRNTVIDLCEKLNLRITEEAFDTQQLLDADEVFICSTFSDIIPVKKIDDVDIGSIPGPVTAQLQQELKRLTDSGETIKL